jgi:hypothetical protein
MIGATVLIPERRRAILRDSVYDLGWRQSLHQVVPDDDGRFDHTLRTNSLNSPALGARRTQPADARRQPLKRHFLARQAQPALQVLI